MKPLDEAMLSGQRILSAALRVKYLQPKRHWPINANINCECYFWSKMCVAEIWGAKMMRPYVGLDHLQHLSVWVVRALSVWLVHWTYENIVRGRSAWFLTVWHHNFLFIASPLTQSAHSQFFDYFNSHTLHRYTRIKSLFGGRKPSNSNIHQTKTNGVVFLILLLLIWGCLSVFLSIYTWLLYYYVTKIAWH